MNKRIILLSDAEIAELYNLPMFTEKDRNIYFSLSSDDHKLLNEYRTLKLKIYFILQLGYFRATQNFYNFILEDVPEDAIYLLNRYFFQSNNILLGKPHRIKIKTQQNIILKNYNYTNWSNDLTPKIISYLLESIKYYPKTPTNLSELFKFFQREKIVIPSYRILQDIFSKVISAEENRLSKIISNIPEYIDNKLNDIANNKELDITFNVIRSDQKNFQYTALRLEIKKAKELEDIYHFCKSFIPKLEISKNGVRYYAQLAENYYSSQLRKIGKTKQLLYLICFIYSHYQQLMDNLIVSFQYHMNSIIDDAKDYANLMNAKHNSELLVDFPKLAKFLKWFPSKEKDNSQLTHIELIKEAYTILPKTQFKLLAKFIEGQSFDKTMAKWQFYRKSSGYFSRYLRPVILSVKFELANQDSYLMQLIEILKIHYAKGKYPATLKIKMSDEVTQRIAKWILPYLKSDSEPEYLDSYKFEFYVYWKMHHYINKGRLVCNDSLSYSDLDCDLVSEESLNNIEEIAEKFGYNKIPIYCDQRLDEALKDLDLAWEETNKNISNGTNKDIELTQDEDGEISWKLKYDAKEKLDDSFFSKLPKIEISELLKFIGDKMHLWDGFTHIKHRYVKRKKPTPLVVRACVLSEALGFDVQKMAEICDINLNTLRSTHQDFIRLESLSETNDIISNYIYNLPIFKAWNLMDEELLADADGQKLATSNKTIQSRYSTKYFGKGTGISVYSLVANHVVVNANTIGLNEYEAHGLYDIVYGNKSNIPINYVTGDNHSINPVNFVVLDSINVGYLPSIKNIKKEANKLYSHKDLLAYEGSIITPKAKIDTGLIKAKKEWVQRILLSLVIQETTQTTIIRKLSSHDRYSQLNAAIFEYNKILKSTHVLNMINDIELRKAIRTARNRTEAYHQLQGAIRKVYNGTFKGKRVIDNRVRAHAVRFVANCIIAYNSTILNALYQRMIKEGVSQSIIDEFIRISPISWSHIIFTGLYSFKHSNNTVDLEKMINLLEEKLRKTLWRNK